MHLKFGISAKFYRRVPTFYGERVGHIQYLETSIASWIGRQGALPLMVPSASTDSTLKSADLDPAAYAAEMDALILQGGVDVFPGLYGEAPEPSEYEYDEARDQYELRLIEAFIKERKPILGICRGFQLLNVYFGGTLYQDLAKSNHRGHFSPDLERKNIHAVKIVPNGMLAQSYASDSGNVVSVHHQGVKKLGDGLLVEAVAADDGLVEAFSFNGDQFILGVQWHPEFQDSSDSGFLDASNLLSALRESARNRKFFGNSEPTRKKKVSFGKSAELSLGGEIELQLLDPVTLDLRPRCLEILKDTEKATPRIKGEIFQSMIEFESGISVDAHAIEKDWCADLELLLPIAKKHGVVLGAAGAHPFAKVAERKLSPGKRYEELVQKNQWIARRLAIFGLHVHVGMRSKEEAIRFYQFYMALSPLFLGLSTSSPFWDGEDTGLSSVRSTFFESTPAGGHPPCLSNWEQFEGLFNKMIASGAIKSHKDLWWDLRPSLTYGTLELRVCDVMPTFVENAAVIALVHLLGLALLNSEQLKIEWPDLSEWSYRENKWRAARHGLDFEFILKDDARTIPAKDYLWTLLEVLEREALNRGYERYFSVLRAILTSGTASDRQCAVWRKTGSMVEVVKNYVREFADNEPNWGESQFVAAGSVTGKK